MQSNIAQDQQNYLLDSTVRQPRNYAISFVPQTTPARLQVNVKYIVTDSSKDFHFRNHLVTTTVSFAPPNPGFLRFFVLLFFFFSYDPILVEESSAM